MVLDELNFAELYQQQMAQAGRTTKAPEHWDARAEQMAESCANPLDPYLLQLKQKIDLSGATTLFDMGCGPGSVCLSLADSLKHVYGVDYSRGMLQVAARRAEYMGLQNVTLMNYSWEDDWQEIPECDIAVASRSTLVADLRQAMIKLNNKAKLRVYTTHTVATSFVDVNIQRAVGRPVVELPNYIFAVNILYQLGIHPNVDYIRGPNCQNKTATFEEFLESVNWSLGKLTDDEQQKLQQFYLQKQASGEPIMPPSRDWALVSWEKTKTL
ncbi:methyltransferase domain-containing protein [Shewanella sp. C32]|uniref:Methyltransferase domain-containing protein n=1 Tax=Shewanella electrica TaxID=515560 RepID=A0ABT2FMH9_9GAMM|nr:class I SAM-dependent methyltransferase [Shewanella electrica]MCH1924723.1 methyltransferase domain-containing protein [Shewanella electrica]MCS4556830.1 methyltransferase domain-containing protein [Shewanella electrica]